MSSRASRLLLALVGMSLLPGAAAAQQPGILWRAHLDAPAVESVVAAPFAEAWVLDSAGTIRRYGLTDGKPLGTSAPELRPLALLAHEGAVLAVGRDDRLTELDETGHEASEGLCLPAPPSAPPVAREGILLVPLEDASLVAVAATAPRVLWRTPLTGPVKVAPALRGRAAAVAGADGMVTLLDARDGSLLGSVRLEAPVEVAPDLAGDLLVVGVPEHPLRGLDARKARERWRSDVGRGPSAPVLGTGERAVVASVAGQLVSLKRNGTPAWRSHLDARVLLGPSLWQGRVLAIPHRRGVLIGFNERDGAETLRVPLPDPLDWFTSPAIPAGDRVLLATRRGFLVAIGSRPAPAPAREVASPGTQSPPASTSPDSAPAAPATEPEPESPPAR